MLGVLAARTRMSEGALFNYCHGHHTFTQSELETLDSSRMHDTGMVRDENLELVEDHYEGFDPRNTARLRVLR
jgi:hypothetical protein